MDERRERMAKYLTVDSIIARSNHILDVIGLDVRYWVHVFGEDWKEPIVEYVNKTWDRLVISKAGYLALVCTDMLIADVDFGDCRLNHRAGAKDINEVIRNVKDLSLLDAQFAAEYNSKLRDYERETKHYDYCKSQNIAVGRITPPCQPSMPIVWSKQTWRIYQTFAGARIICSSKPVSWLMYDGHPSKTLERVFRFLRVDPDYLTACQKSLDFRARLTPKYGRKEDYVVKLIDIVEPELTDMEVEMRRLEADDETPDGRAAQLYELIRLHDEICDRHKRDDDDNDEWRKIDDEPIVPEPTPDGETMPAVEKELVGSR